MMAAFYIGGLPLSCRAQRIAFWNVENLFDTYDDTLTLDDEYTPRGAKHWTQKRYEEKLNQIYKTIMALDAPMAMGLAEVENDRVLNDLCRNTPLRKAGYAFVHYDSPDRRGVDCALIYDSLRFRPFRTRVLSLSDTSGHYFTRDILQVSGVTSQADTIVMFVCHFPSKRGGATAEKHRMEAARRLRLAMDSARTDYPSATVIALGDFNATPLEPPMLKGLGLPCDQYENLMATLPPGEGTYCYQGHWDYIDQVIVSKNTKQKAEAGVFRMTGLMTDDPRRLSSHPRRTYSGPRYQGGASDHLPVYLDLKSR